MKPTSFDGANLTLTAPEPGGPEGCGNLPVRSDGDSTTSCWELDGPELLEVLVTRRVFASVWSGGKTQPAISLFTTTPFPEGRDLERRGEVVMNYAAASLFVALRGRFGHDARTRESVGDQRGAAIARAARDLLSEALASVRVSDAWPAQDPPPEPEAQGK